MTSAQATAVFVLAHPWAQDRVRQAAPPDFDVQFLVDASDPHAARVWLPRADFLVTVNLPAAWVPLLARCRLVQLQGVGYDGVALAALHRAGIPLAATPEGTVVGVAEHTLLLILALYRQLVAVQESVRQGQFDSMGWRAGCHTLCGKQLGIVGLGRIGRRVAQLARAFGVRLVYHDVAPAPAAVEQELQVTRIPFDRLLSESDIVSVHAPLTETTRGLFDAAAFARMKPGALFINTSRGETYDMDALHRALRSGHLGGAGLDVFHPEPPPPHPLLHLPNVLCTPHMATGTVEAHVEKAQAQFANFRRVLRGEPPLNLIPMPAVRQDTQPT